MKMRVVVVVEYEANLNHYPANSGPKEISDIDEAGFNDNPDVVFEMMQDNPTTIIVDSPWNGFVKTRP